MEKDFYTVKEFANAYKCSPGHVYEWLRTGKIRHYERPTPHAIYRIPKTELARLKGEEGAASEESAVQQPIHKVVDPMFVKPREEHFLDLTSMANSLLVNDLDRVKEGGTITRITGSGEQNESRQVEYMVTGGSNFGGIYELTKEQLSAQLQENIEFAIHVYKEQFFYDWFLPHLLSELPEEIRTEWFWTIVKEQPYQLIDTLRLLADRKTFKGTCPVCKDWQ